MKKKQTIEDKVLHRIYGFRRGSVFTPSLFLHLGTRAAIDQTLSRLVKRGIIRRLARGLYDYPKTHPKFGLLDPPVQEIAAALTKSAQTKLQPSGAYAANLIGLSEQVPMKTVFLITGTPRRVQIGRREIILKRTTPRQMKTGGSISGLVIQALRYLGKRQVNVALLASLRKRLSAKDRRRLLADAHLAPAWIAQYLRVLARDET